MVCSKKDNSYEYNVERKIHLLKDTPNSHEISQNVYNTPIRKHTHTHTCSTTTFPLFTFKASVSTKTTYQIEEKLEWSCTLVTKCARPSPFS